jgi:hypothetical protein
MNIAMAHGMVNRMRIYSDGNQVAVIAERDEEVTHGAIFYGYYCDSLSFTYDQAQVWGVESSYPLEITTSVRAEFCVKSMGKAEMLDAEQAENAKRLLASANELSISELLRIVYQKMDNRES